MDDLAAFIEARLADDEAIARDALHGPASEPWRAQGYDRVVQRGFKNATEMNDKLIADCAPMGATRARHIARHDPARVLREVTAKRAIVAEHAITDWTAYGDHMCTCCHREADHAREDEDQCTWVIWPCPTIRHLAAAWSDHPDYRAEWAPAL